MVSKVKSYLFPEIKNKSRKKLHYSLLGLVVALQFILLLIGYNEVFNQKKLNSISEDLEASKLSDKLVSDAKVSYLMAQNDFYKFLLAKDTLALKSYFSEMSELVHSLDSIKNLQNNTRTFNGLIKNHSQINQDISYLKMKVDSMLLYNDYFDYKDDSDLFKIKEFKEDEILNSVDVESFVVVDSISRKGLFSRLLAALSGRIDIQKEIMNVKVTMKYGKNTEIGNVEEQLKLAFEHVTNHYKTQFKNLQNNYNLIQNKDLELLHNNAKMERVVNSLLESFSQTSKQAKEQVENQFEKQKGLMEGFKFVIVFGIIIILIALSFVLIQFTKMAFDYEEKLETAQLQIQQNLNFKNRIVGMISHEVRSPLSLISIYSKIIRSKIQDDEVKEVFQSVDFTTHSLLLMSNQILEFSKSENAKLELKFNTYNLYEDLTKITNSLKDLVESKGNTLKLKIQVDKSTMVFSDAVKIHQLLYNIVGNANKFTDKGTISIDVKENFIDSKKLELKFEIQDTGRGISETDLKYVFEAYHQGTISENVNDLGAGLGLNLCKEIVELFNGEINLSSEVHKGTRVEFNIFVDKI
ncbi:sensor histidine kinase [Flavobacterium sp.]|uniref:sensor histidine kinase n=1 Tax=Flavobacterium sp. TaxID=239 RepID=UPI002FDA7FDB